MQISAQHQGYRFGNYNNSQMIKTEKRQKDARGMTSLFLHTPDILFYFQIL